MFIRGNRSPGHTGSYRNISSYHHHLITHLKKAVSSVLRPPPLRLSPFGTKSSLPKAPGWEAVKLVPSVAACCAAPNVRGGHGHGFQLHLQKADRSAREGGCLLSWCGVDFPTGPSGELYTPLDLMEASKWAGVHLLFGRALAQ